MTVKQYGANIAGNHKLVPETDEDGNIRMTAERLELAYEKTLAIALVDGADPTKYGTLITDLANKFASGRDEYPDDVTTAYNLLVNYRTPTNAPQPRNHAPAPTAATVSTTTTAASTAASVTPPTGSAITFIQSEAPPVPGDNGTTYADVLCYACNNMGHLRR